MFRLIQTGTFDDRNIQNGGLILASPKSVFLEYMGVTEFDGARTNSLCRIFCNFKEYELYSTGIFTPSNEELLIWAKSENILNEIKAFIKTPYRINHGMSSHIELVPTSTTKEEAFWNRRSFNFWWNVEKDEFGDWIAFLSPYKNSFLTGIKKDYETYWLIAPEAEKKARCKLAFQ